MKPFLSILALLLSLSCALAQVPIPSNLCQDCMLWVNPYYISIADVKKHNPIVVYEVVTRAHLLTADSLKNTPGRLNRARFPFHALDGHPSETATYKGKRFGPNNTVIAKGHLAPFDDYSWSKEAAATSMVYTFNLAPEPQSQNVGTELGTENMVRAMARQYDSVKVWAGTWGMQGTISNKKGDVIDNIPAIYWKLVCFNHETHCYWMPNNDDGAGQANYPKFEIPMAELVVKLQFDPREVIKP